jgi:hypothetical protein
VPIVLVLIPFVVGSLLVFVWALCAIASRADARHEWYVSKVPAALILNWSSLDGAPLRDARDRRRTARPGSPERRRRPRLSNEVMGR